MSRLTRGCVPLVEAVRGGTVESVHHGFVVAADASGRILLSAGDPGAVTFLRSSAKPFQAVPMVAASVPERFGLTGEETAIAIGSHSGEDRHVEAVSGLLRKIGLGEEALRCGAHPPFHAATRERELRLGNPKSVLRHNCSGKHAGMLALAKAIGAPVDSYLEPDHPVQRRILEAIASFAGLPPEKVALGVDGCGVPAHALPLRKAAVAYARLMDGSDSAGARVAELMRRHPAMIGGEGRADTVLMETAEVIAKEGAEGYAAAGWRDAAGKAVGLVVKIADGRKDDHAREFVLIEALRALGVFTEIPDPLAKACPSERFNHAGKRVGALTMCAELKLISP